MAKMVDDKSTMPSLYIRSNTYNDKGMGHRKIKQGIANILMGMDDGCDERGLFISLPPFSHKINKLLQEWYLNQISMP